MDKLFFFCKNSHHPVSTQSHYQYPNRSKNSVYILHNKVDKYHMLTYYGKGITCTRVLNYAV